MIATRKTITITPAVPAVTEDRVILDLSIDEARILRALFGKTSVYCGGLLRQNQRVDAANLLNFLAPLNGLFPGDYAIKYRGIHDVRIEIGDEA